ncbi:hypothetical protein EV424DRAFT_273547 [Suillus variegatus]|nr:hypothetical protein EV424DRAFT_273547 [Suillus variegatus]
MYSTSNSTSRYFMVLPLVLYDILSELPGNNWSANPTKFILSCKDIPFGRTMWVENSDIFIAVKAIGAKSNKRPNGSDVHTVPVLSDPNTGALVTDSLEIASYLEKTYPEKAIFPNSEALIRTFDSAYFKPPSTCYQVYLRTLHRNIESRQFQVLHPSSFGGRVVALGYSTTFECRSGTDHSELIQVISPR